MKKIRKFKEAKRKTWIPPEKYAEMKNAEREAKEQNKTKDQVKEKMNYFAQCTSTTAETTELFDANQLNEGFEYNSYITIATIEKGLKDNGQGTEIAKKGTADNIHIDKQKEGSPKTRTTKTSTIQIKTLVQTDDLQHLHRAYGEEDGKKTHTMLKCMTRQSADLLELEENTETAILDTGCTRSTSGRQWIEAHIRSLSEEDNLEVRRKKEKHTSSLEQVEHTSPRSWSSCRYTLEVVKQQWQ